MLRRCCMKGTPRWQSTRTSAAAALQSLQPARGMGLSNCQ